MTSQGLAREARAGVFTLVCLSLSVVLHAWAAGALPSVPAIFAGAGLVLAVALVLAGRERRYPLIATVLLVSQVGLHYLFDALPHAGHHGVAAVVPSAPLSGAMVLAHVVAGLFAAFWLRGGEAAVWRLFRWAARSLAPLRFLWALVLPLTRPAFASAVDAPTLRPAPGWRLSVIRRGPPVAA